MLSLIVCLFGSSFDCVIDALCGFLLAHLVSPADFAGATDLQVQTIINNADFFNLVGATIRHVAVELQKAPWNGAVPTSKAGLLAIGVDTTVASLLMSHVFGSTDIVIGLHARKILTALDMYDWEESGVKKKTDVKMVNIPTSLVKKSLKTWLPKGDSRDFYDLMDSIGSLLQHPQPGDWGKLTKPINRVFAPKEKQALFEMVENITQFYRATRAGGKKTSCG